MRCKDGAFARIGPGLLTLAFESGVQPGRCAELPARAAPLVRPDHDLCSALGPCIQVPRHTSPYLRTPRPLPALRYAPRAAPGDTTAAERGLPLQSAGRAEGGGRPHAGRSAQHHPHQQRRLRRADQRAAGVDAAGAGRGPASLHSLLVPARRQRGRAAPAAERRPHRVELRRPGPARYAPPCTACLPCLPALCKLPACVHCASPPSTYACCKLPAGSGYCRAATACALRAHPRLPTIQLGHSLSRPRVAPPVAAEAGGADAQSPPTHSAAKGGRRRAPAAAASRKRDRDDPLTKAIDVSEGWAPLLRIEAPGCADPASKEQGLRTARVRVAPLDTLLLSGRQGCKAGHRRPAAAQMPGAALFAQPAVHPFKARTQGPAARIHNLATLPVPMPQRYMAAKARRRDGGEDEESPSPPAQRAQRPRTAGAATAPRVWPASLLLPSGLSDCTREGHFWAAGCHGSSLCLPRETPGPAPPRTHHVQHWPLCCPAPSTCNTGPCAASHPLRPTAARRRARQVCEHRQRHHGRLGALPRRRALRPPRARPCCRRPAARLCPAAAGHGIQPAARRGGRTRRGGAFGAWLLRRGRGGRAAGVGADCRYSR